MKDIIIFSGQSNMQGQTDRLLTCDIPEGAAYEYKWLDDALVPLADPAGEDITRERTRGRPFTKETDQGEWLSEHISGGSCYGNTTLVPSFCAEYCSLTGREAVAGHYGARGMKRIGEEAGKALAEYILK